MTKAAKKILIFSCLLIVLSVAVNFALAADTGPDVGLNQAAGIGLGSADPRVIAANIIRIVLGFLGILAVGLIIYAGFIWMTAEGNEEKVEQGKKILIGAVIGLVISLASFAIASFVLNSLLEATNGTGGGANVSGSTIPGGGGGTGGTILPGEGQRCLTGALDTQCAAGICASGLSCSGANCTCAAENRPTEGQSCDLNTGQPGCQAGDCADNLVCSTNDNCTCIRTPLIGWISPLDASSTPNGATGNFITIGGRYFGATAGQVIFLGDPNNAGDDKVAPLASQVNPDCVSTWRDNQIVVAVPAGAASGPIKVADSSGKYDTTDNSRGPAIRDFQINSTRRPGICSADPASGKLADPFTLQGASFNGTPQAVLFGSALSSVPADSQAGWTTSSVRAAVPNLRPGDNSIFARIGGVDSNYLSFAVESNASQNPVVDYIEPRQGPAGQYITIYGRNFINYDAQKSSVKFYFPSDPSTLINADIDFPAACRSGWWHDTYITVKVPRVSNLGAYKVVVTNSDTAASAPADFTITTGTPGPGLCALEPNNGPVGQPVSLNGEQFGASQGSGSVQYYNNVSGGVRGWTDFKIDSNVPSGAASGPVKALSGQGGVSNSLPFRVGKCSASSECSYGEECCGGGTYWSGICRPTGSCSAGSSTSCGFGWNFSTGGSNASSTCATGQTSCGASCCAAGQTCDPFGNGGLGKCDGIVCAYATCGQTCCSGSNTCTNGACSSGGVDTPCTDDSACSAGLQCDQTTHTCQPQPGLTITDYQPSGNNACRNSIVSVTFSQLLDRNTLNDNIIVAGDYGTDQCPASTKYLTLNRPDWFGRLKNWLSGLPVLDKFLPAEARALDGNFCSVTGTMKIQDRGSQTEVQFSPAQPLDAGRKYYVIVKSDPNPADGIIGGVLSRWGATLSAPLDSQTFNSVAYQGKIWSFVTKAATASDSGICRLNGVAINPAAYLFKTAVNDTTDDDPANALYDTIRDSDKVFYATAYSAENQPIAPVNNVYSWRWDWSVDDQSVAKFNGNSAYGADNSSSQVINAQNIKEANTLVHAKATIVQDTINGVSTLGSYKENSSQIYVFLCANPWPYYKADGTWEPWNDTAGNCSAAAGSSCANTNFSIYYCRDSGGAGTADDLPAILSDNAVIRGSSAEQNLIKEFYFFREGSPDVSGINLTAATSNEVKQGGKAGLAWQAVNVPAGQTLDKYLIYYGTKSKDYTKSISASAPGTAQTPAVVGNLANGIKYYFAVTARYKSGAESAYSNEVMITPADIWAPVTPIGLSGRAATSSAVIVWNDNTDDTVGYKVYYGAESGNLGTAAPLSKSKCSAGKCSLTVKDLNGGTRYYFSVAAIDYYSNESNKSAEINLTAW